jgi:hypothetical protein
MHRVAELDLALPAHHDDRMLVGMMLQRTEPSLRDLEIAHMKASRFALLADQAHARDAAMMVRRLLVLRGDNILPTEVRPQMHHA